MLERKGTHFSRSEVFPLVAEKKEHHKTTISCSDNRIRPIDSFVESMVQNAQE